MFNAFLATLAAGGGLLSIVYALVGPVDAAPIFWALAFFLFLGSLYLTLVDD